MRKAFLTALAAASVAVCATPAGAHTGPTSVIGAVDGTTQTQAAQRFLELRTAESKSARSTQPAQQDHNSWGVFTSGEIDGQDAVQSTYSDLRISSDTLYAPTMKAPNSCIELVTSYSHGSAQVWAWDWCERKNVGKSVTMDSQFLQNYGTKVNGHDAYRGKVELTDKSSNEWTASLYNYRTKNWDTFWTKSGEDQTPKDGRSWNIFEIYADGSTAEYCSKLGSRVLESSGYQIKKDGQWEAATDKNSEVRTGNAQDDFRCAGIVKTMVHPNDNWTVHR